MKKVTATGALGLATALLGLQILLGIEYTTGGTLGTQASMIFAMVTLALLPVFIEAARRSGHKAIAGALFVAFVAFLAYSLPATTGRTGEIKETKVAAASDVAKLRDDLERTTKMADWARQDWMTECGSGEGKKCRAKRNTVQALEDRVAKLNGDIKAAGAATGDMGSDLWAWATGLPPATVRKLSVLAFAVGMDMAIWALIWLATSLLSAPVRAVNDNQFRAFDHIEPLPPTKALPPELKATNIVDWTREFRKAHGRDPKWPEVKNAWPDVSKTTAWRRVKAA